MTLAEKIDYLNEISNGCFVVTHHLDWEFSPYGGPFSCIEKMYKENYGFISAPTFTELIDKCYEIAKGLEGDK